MKTWRIISNIENPTLNELTVFLSKFEDLLLDIDSQGKIKVVNESDLPFRTVN